MPTVISPINASPINARSTDAGIYSNRLHSRRRLDVRAHLLTRHSPGGRLRVVHGRTVDLSRSGAGVILAGELVAGTEVMLCLRLTVGGDALCLRAVVTQRHGFRTGLVFVHPTAAQRLQLRELCRD